MTRLLLDADPPTPPAGGPPPTPAPAPTPAAAPVGIDETRLQAFGASLLGQIKQMIAPPPVPAAERTAQQKAADADAKLVKVENAGRKVALRELAARVGVDPERYDQFTREFAHEVGTPTAEKPFGLKYDIEEGLSYVDPLGSVVPVDQIATKFLTSKNGSIFKAAPPVRAAGGLKLQTGSGAAGAPDRPFYSELSPDQRAKMTAAERAQYAQDDLRRSRAS